MFHQRATALKKHILTFNGMNSNHLSCQKFNQTLKALLPLQGIFLMTVCKQILVVSLYTNSFIYQNINNKRWACLIGIFSCLKQRCSVKSSSIKNTIFPTIRSIHHKACWAQHCFEVILGRLTGTTLATHQYLMPSETGNPYTVGYQLH